MTRLPLDLAAEVCGIRPGTLRRWVHEHHVTRYWDGFDVDELLAYRDSRDVRFLAARAGVKHPERFGVSPLGGP